MGNDWRSAASDLFLKHQAALGLPDEYERSLQRAIVPLARFIERTQEAHDETLCVGLSAAQGCGKTTACFFIEQLLADVAGLCVVTLSLDDFYLTRHERQQLAESVHPLMATRGVPGTHDVPLLRRCIDRLRHLEPAELCEWPRFDKSQDDRVARSDWASIEGPQDVILLEGWCVGAMAQDLSQLEQALNELEQQQDPDGSWRHYVNNQLGGPYRSLWRELDCLIFLQAPSMSQVVQWRKHQERKLRTSSSRTSSVGKPDRVMSDSEVERFIMHYERVTRHMLSTLPQVAEVNVPVDEQHELLAPHFRAAFTTD